MYKKAIFILLVLLINACNLKNTVQAAEDDDFKVHRLVIQMNKGDEHLQSEVITNIVNISKYFGVDNVEIELVAYGKGFIFSPKKVH